jgi:hypothetical protein
MLQCQIMMIAALAYRSLGRGMSSSDSDGMTGHRVGRPAPAGPAEAVERPRCCACGQDPPLLVANRWMAARHRRAPLPPLRLLARGGPGLLPADLGPARFG